MRRRILFIFGIIIFLLLVGFSARAYSNPGKPTGFVNDYAGMLNSEQVTSLNAKLTQFSAETSNEISVVTIKSLNGDSIENYAVKLFADWGIGKDKKDNGVLLLISLDDRKMRIETGYGLEGALPDATTYQIITKTLKPAFQAGDYNSGINSAVDQIISATKGEYTADPTTKSTGLMSHLNIDSIFWIVIGLFYGLGALWRYLAKSRNWWEGGIIGLVIGLVLALIFLRTLIFLIFLPLGVGILGLIFDFLVSRVLPKPKTPKKGGNHFWFFGGPGSFGGGSGGGLGGGGFGGFGGGSSGGGGGSGSW